MTFHEVSNCRACGNGQLNPVLSLGEQYVVDFVDDPANPRKPRAPLDLVMCPNCYLVQLKHSVNQDVLYKEFWYRSGISEVMRKALKDIVDSALKLAPVTHNDMVLDIGCNDGTMLGMYPSEVIKVGVDPSKNLEAEREAIVDINVTDYFSIEALESRIPPRLLGRGFRVITSVAMFYDLDDPVSFLHDVKALLASNGVFIVQMNYLKGMLEQNAFDNICHEHLTYFSLTSFKWLAERVGFEIVDVETNDVNGGSFRVYLVDRGNALAVMNSERYVQGRARIKKLLLAEEAMGLKHLKVYQDFAKRVNTIIDVLGRTIIKEAAQVRRVYLYGASTRGSTLMQALFPGSWRCVCGAAERDPNKWGKYTIGTGIKIDSEEELRKRADVFVVLPWHFWNGIREREKEWLANGGRFILPLPQPLLITEGSVQTLSTVAESHKLETMDLVADKAFDAN